jgi:iron complex outermembrane receptor protein
MRLKAIVLLLPALYAHAQQNAPAKTSTQETVTVVGQAEPVIAGQSSRSVTSIDLEATPNLVPSLADALRTDSSVDIQMRGPMGVQSDLSVRGSTFEQTLVTVNGLRMNDAETSHFTLDIPIPLNALGTLDILHGAGSTLYGSDAIAGTVDIRTIRPTQSSLRATAAYGSYGINQQSFVASGVRARATEVLSAARDFSTGFIPDRDYRSESVASETGLTSALGQSDLLLAVSDRAFGANQFYGAYPSYERTKGWFAGLTQSFAEKTSVAVAYRRHTDEFVLFRSNPALYENNHIDESWQAVLRRKDTIGQHTTVLYGLDNNLDQINSNSLGQHGRNRSAGYADLDLRSRRATFSAGLREEVIGGYGVVSSPGFSGAFSITPALRASASAGYGFRLPTYVDKYYNDPTTIANPNLKPESAWSYDGGLTWFARPSLTLTATGFTSRQSNAIDYVRSGGTGPYQAQNLTSVDLTGAEISLQTQITHTQRLRLSYTGITGAQSALAGLQSRYLFNYPTHNANAEWIASLRQVDLRMRVAAAQRYQRTAYATLDLSAARSTGRVRPYLQMTNLTNTGYQEISGIRMQGRAFVGGLQFVLSQKN